MTNSAKPNKINLTSFSKLLLGLFLITFLIIAYQFFISAILIVKPGYTISQWENKKQKLDNAQAQEVLSRLASAEKQGFLSVKLIDETSIHTLYSRLYLLLSTTDHSDNNYQNLAEFHALQLTQEAPSHYLGWTLLALAKTNDQHYSWDDQSALSKSLTLGPNEKNNQIRLMPVLIQYWSRLSTENKTLSLSLMRSALNNPNTDHIAAKNMRKFDNIAPFNQLIENSRYKDRILRILTQ